MSVDLRHGDCIEIMRAMPQASVDAVVTDPPYCSGGVSESQRTQAIGQGLRSDTIGRFGWFVGDNMETAGLVWTLRQVAIESLRILKPSGSLLLFCDWRMLSSIQPAIESAGFRSQNLVVWDKEHMGLGNGFRCQHELILHFTAGAPVYHHKGTANVLRCRRVSRADREHQTQKPVDLMSQLLAVVAPRGGVICDPFMGSASTGVAAVAADMSFIGIERDPDYYAIARKRIADAQAAHQPRLVG